MPQAKFSISVHPICLVVLQFLPLSALLYKGGVLLVDSANFDFARYFVGANTQIIKDKIQASATSSAQIDNVKDFTKGHYLIKALEIFEEKKIYWEQYTDLNLWSFSNSGTGASCEIDRIPNTLFQKLRELNSPVLRNELKLMLTSKMSNRFIEDLNDGKDFWGLYPAKNYDGVSVDFFEAYQKVIGKTRLLVYAKYITGLILKTDLTKSEQKLLEKTDAYNQKEYVDYFLKTLADATSKKQWNLIHHSQILDDASVTPLRAYVFGIYKLVHYYFQKKKFDIQLPNTEGVSNKALSVCKIFVEILNKNKDAKGNNIIDDLKGRDFQEPTLNEPMIRIGSQIYEFENLYTLIYNSENNKQSKYGLRELLRIYFNNPIELPDIEGDCFVQPTEEQKEYLKKIELFADAYFKYYNEKYVEDYDKFNRHVLKPMRGQGFQIAKWLNSSIENMIFFYKEEGEIEKLMPLSNEDVFSENLLYDFMGSYNSSFARFAIEYYLNQKFHLSTQKETV